MTPKRRSLLADKSYLSMWTVGALYGIVRWLELLAFGLYAWDVTGSPVLVALLALLRFAPLAVFGIFFGALADIADARKLMLGGIALIIVVNLSMLALFAWGNPQYWHIAVATVLAGTFWATDMPLRRRIIGDIVPQDRLAEAMSLDNATSNGTRMIGPLAGGIIYQFIGISGTFVLGVALYAVSLALTWTLAYTAETTDAPVGRSLMRPISGSLEALKYAFKRDDVLRILAVTVIFNVWAFPMVSMVPVIGRQTLELSATWIGIVSSLEGLCAFIGAVLIARFARPRHFRPLYYYGTFLHLVCVFILGTTATLIPFAMFIALAGLCTACLGAMQSTLIYLVAPPGMRGRFLGLMTICVGTGLVGFANIGVTAEYFGASNAMCIVAAEGVIPMLLVGWKWRELTNPGTG